MSQTEKFNFLVTLVRSILLVAEQYIFTSKITAHEWKITIDGNDIAKLLLSSAQFGAVSGRGCDAWGGLGAEKRLSEKAVA